MTAKTKYVPGINLDEVKTHLANMGQTKAEIAKERAREKFAKSLGDLHVEMKFSDYGQPRYLCRCGIVTKVHPGRMNNEQRRSLRTFCLQAYDDGMDPRKSVVAMDARCEVAFQRSLRRSQGTRRLRWRDVKKRATDTRTTQRV